ncbi:hypothetical protein QUA43_28800 [Microcoleus sp. N9_B4]|uniref:hypothetical protein n=1 Tax=Microcoleus sp. N9_B4 TaxID=3055386 RepID=UPI002FD36A97
MGNPRCQGDRVRLAIGGAILSRESTSVGCFACKQDSWARSRQASATNAELHRLACVVPGNDPS